MSYEHYRTVSEANPDVERVRQAEIEEIQARARGRFATKQARIEEARRHLGDPMPYSGNEDRTVVDVHLPPMDHPEDRANLPA